MLGQESLNAGESAFAQLRLQRPVFTLYGDRFILRRQSPPVTIGGGVIIGGDEFVMMAGPCTVESEEQLFKTAAAVFRGREAGLQLELLGEKGNRAVTQVHGNARDVGVGVLEPFAGFAQPQPATEEGRSRFRTIDIFVDSRGNPLAAYQVEFSATNGVVKIVGIEGGEPEAFRQPPVYDPKAMQKDRVIIASFSTAAAATLPTGKTRVATIHIQVSGDHEPQFQIKLQTAGDSRGRKISAQATFEERKLP